MRVYISGSLTAPVALNNTSYVCTMFDNGSVCNVTLSSVGLKGLLQYSRELLCHAFMVTAPLHTEWCLCNSFTSFPSIPLGHDVIAQAQSGTGKTATFAIALLQKLDMDIKDCQAMVLAPTRELAQQVNASILLFFSVLMLITQCEVLLAAILLSVLRDSRVIFNLPTVTNILVIQPISKLMTFILC